MNERLEDFNETPPTSAEALMGRILDGTADDRDRARLARLLQDSGELRARWREQTTSHALLRACAGSLPATQPPAVPLARLNRRHWISLAAAAAIALCAALVAITAARHPARPMRVLEAVGAESFAAGQTENLRAIRLEHGALRLQLSDGAVLSMTAPVSLRFEGKRGLFLERGRILVESHGAGDFYVQTPQTRVEDARGSVGVGCQGGKTDVAVFDGTARLNPKDGAPFALTANEAVRLSASAVPERIACIQRDINDVEWAWSPVLNADTVISEVRDNQRGSENFYRIALGGMREGVPVRYRGNAYWFAKNEDEFPHWLENADLLDFMPEAANRTDYAVRLGISQPALVCVLFPDAAPRPEWLIRDFKQSDVRLCTRDGIGRTTGTFSVWRRVVDEPGVVELGAITGEKGSSGYAVTTKALSTPSLAQQAKTKFFLTLPN